MSATTSIPRHATGADDVRVTIAGPAARVVSQDSAIDEYLYSIVSPERVVGVSQSAFEVDVCSIFSSSYSRRTATT